MLVHLTVMARRNWACAISKEYGERRMYQQRSETGNNDSLSTSTLGNYLDPLMSQEKDKL